MTDICDETAMWRDDVAVKAAATAKAAPSGGGEVETLWETMAEELVSLIACYLSPIAPGSPSLSSSPGYHPAAWLACPPLSLPAAKTHWAESSIGAAHWVQLSRALRAAVPTWCAELSTSRRSHLETAACCRVIDSQNEEAYDWPLQVLRLREGPGAQAEGSRLSHATPISRQSLRLAYWAVAKEVHPDRLQLGRDSSTRSIATQAMAVLNEAYRQAQLYFSEREEHDICVIELDMLGIEHR